ncbi:MAG: VanZ family protein [Candidatus Saganbacteria bacterium]|nr:VanZ family protein [Candidatus Saganbacteria bacterium]
MKNKLFWIRALLVCWIIGIFALSMIPEPGKHFPLPDLATIFLVLHFIAFFVLFFLFYLSFSKKNVEVLWSSFLLCMLISFLKEWEQLFVAGRYFAVEDLFFDGIAALLAMGLTFVLDF